MTSTTRANAARPAPARRAVRGTGKATEAPARRDPAATRDALLRSAVAEFARAGFAGARVDEIAQAAGVNKQLVYHYWGSKQGLYLASLESVYAEIREKERRLSLGDKEPREAMAQLVGFSFDYLAEHPEFIAMLADENRNQGSHVLASGELQQMHMPFVEMLEQTLKRGVAAGVFRDDYDAINLYISIAGISYFFFSNNHTLSAIFGRRLGEHGSLLQRRRHVIEFALNALRAEPVRKKR